MMKTRVFRLCGEAAACFLFVYVAVLVCNGSPDGVVVVRHGVGDDPSVSLTAPPAAINLWRVAAVALATAAAARLWRAVASALPGPLGLQGWEEVAPSRRGEPIAWTGMMDAGELRGAIRQAAEGLAGDADADSLRGILTLLLKVQAPTDQTPKGTEA